MDENLPLERAIAQCNPANNGEALARRVGDPVGSRERKLFDPVTTEAKAEMAFTVARQICERHKTPALFILVVVMCA